ncbi:MAG: hypothetical protein ACI9JM_000467 [Halioglobus sp.]|jgi:hypothetical protein
MNTKRLRAIIIFVPFMALTVYSIAEVGYIGLFEYQLQSSAGWQVFADLAIVLVLVLSWLVPVARREGRNPWPWVVATSFLGSIAPLAYLAMSKTRQEA